MSRTTIKDVAKKAGVSVSSVSFIFNGKDYKVSPETKKKVLKIASELGYHPNNNARSLRMDKSNLIGFICPDICNGYYSTIAKKIEDNLHELNYTLLIGNSAYTIDNEIRYIQEFTARRVDYLIIIPSADSLKNKTNEAKLEKALKQSELPFVVLDRRTTFNKHSEICNDDIYGAKLATEYLLSKGYKKIACITGPNNVSSSIDRLEGYKKALKENGIKFDAKLVKEGNYSNESGVAITRQFIDEKIDFDSIFAFNDLMAYGVYQVFSENNINIPNDKAVVGCDDLYFSSLINPSLTSIKPDLDGIVKVVGELIRSNNPSVGSKAIRPTLSIRESVKRKCHD